MEDEIFLGKNIEYYNQMRSKSDTKGGGLLIMHKRSDKISFSQVDSDHKDILEIEGTCNKMKIRIVLVYFGVKKTKKANEDNEVIRKKQKK